MSRPTLEVADIVRTAGNSFWEKYRSHLAWPHRKVLDAIVRCRTAALSGHLDQCVRCGHQAISFNSCRNRHCPKCQGNARAKWLAARSAELLPVPYFHVVFTLPHELSALVLQNKRLLYDLLYRISAATMLELARDPRHLGADIGFLGLLHTWGQSLEHHPHVHYIVPAGGLAPDGSSRLSTSFDVEGLQPMAAKSKYQNRIELLQGTLDMLILKTLQWGEQHGYGISQAIRVNSGEVLQVETGSLYPALHRLERQGWVKAEWKKSESNQRAKFYKITKLGKEQLASDYERWGKMVATIEGIMTAK